MRTIALFTLLSANSLFSQEQVKPDSVQTIHLKREGIDEEIEGFFVIPDQDPVFPGGTLALSQWLAQTIVYPPLAIEMNLQGKVYFKFVVETDGTLSDIRIVRGVPDCPECDKEALRVMKLMPAWIPAQKEGKPMRTSMMMPIIFRLQ
jgi:protein TonB